MSFGTPPWFWGLLALPLLAALFFRAERRGKERLRNFVSPRLLPQLAGAVNYFRRALRFGLQLLGLALALMALAQPRWGYTFEEATRKGVDLLIAVDTSRSMLSNDVQPNRLDRVKLSAQDLIAQLQGDRVGLLAFAGRGFIQAPLTIDYGAVVEALNDLDTKTIPEGGTNISEAINLATKTYGKSAEGNRALIIYTDGEELSGDAVKTAKAAADAGVRIFTIGVGTPEGSLIPVPGDEGGTGFVKDSKGQVVKSKLDEKRLREIAEATGGFYLHLENGPLTMQQLYEEGIAKMRAADIDARMSQRPIERYEWPLGAAILALAMSILVGERKRVAVRTRVVARTPIAATIAALLLGAAPAMFASRPGLDFYRDGKFNDAYQEFEQTLKAHPQSKAEDKLQFDAGTAAYKMKDYPKALESFSQALLTPDTGLQSKSHYNLGNTLYQRGEAQSGDEKKLADWTNALQHYEQTLKIDPQNKEAKENSDYVKKKIKELKNKKQQQPSPAPTPTPPPKDQQKNDKQDKQDQQKDQNKQQQQSPQDQKQDEKEKQDQQKQDQSGSGKDQKPENKPDQSQAKNDPPKQDQPKAGESPTPSPTAGQDNPQDRQSSSGDKQDGQSPSPTPGGKDESAPSPSPGEDKNSAGEEGSPSPTPTPADSKKKGGEVKSAVGEKSDKPQKEQMADAEPEKEGEMSERQAESLLQSMKDEEARVRLDERKAARRVYNDW